MEHNEHHCHAHAASPYKLNNKLLITLAVFGVIFGLSYLPILNELNEGFISYLSLIWWAVLLGLFIGGLIDYFVPKAFIYKYLGKKGFISIIYSVLAGFMLSACSHGILAIAIQLYKKGASIPAVVTFLLASPWANFPVTILLFSFFGFNALLIIIAAMVIAVITGLVFLLLEKNQLIEHSLTIESDEDYSWDKIKSFDLNASVKGVAAGTISLANMVLWWIIIGFIIAAFIKAYVPHDIFNEYFGASFAGLASTLAVATVIEVCSEGSSPIAFEVYNQVGALGNPFVFLMAGVVTDYTEIGLLWSNIGKRTAIWLPLITVPQVLVIGYLFNILL